MAQVTNMDNASKSYHDPVHAMQRLVLRGTAGAFLVRGLAAVAGLGMNVALARILSLSDYGVVALGLSWLTITGTIACFGTDTVAMRFVAEGIAKHDNVQVSGVVRWGGRFSIVLGVIGAIVSTGLLGLLFRGYSATQLQALWLIVAATPLLAFTLNRASVLRGEKKVILGATLEMLMRPLGVLLLTLTLYFALGSFLGVVQAAAIVLVAQALPAIIGAIKSTRLTKDSKGPIESGQTSFWLRVATPIAAMNIMGVVIGNLDTIVIGYFVDPNSAGVYRASAQLATLVAFGLMASNGIVAPLIAELYSSGRKAELRRILRYSVTLVSVGSIVGVAIMAMFGTHLLGLFGADFQTGYHALLILLMGQSVNALCGPTGFMMSMTGHQNQAMRIFAVSTAINVALNLVLVPCMGLIGGAIANVVGMSLWNLAILVYLRGRLQLDPSVFSWFSFVTEAQERRGAAQNV